MAANSKGPRADAVGSGDGKRDVTGTVVTPALPEDLTVDATVDWVSGDKARAEIALKAEKKRDNPRSSLVHTLERIVNDETGAGVASGEA